MPTDALDAPALLEALGGAAAALQANEAVLNNLNVFPVPDGDTGTNMLHTLRSGLATLEAGGGVDALAAAATGCFAADSRGNSGFLVASYFEAFFRTLGGHASVDAALLVGAMDAGSAAATSALLHPRDGTMLTAMSGMVHALHEAEAASVTEVLTVAGRAGRDAVRSTPDHLPVLRSAGVIDAGALGFTLLVEGMGHGLEGRPPVVEVESDHRFTPDPDAPVSTRSLQHRYCTEFHVDNPGDLPLDDLREVLVRLGDSVAIARGAGGIRVHVHTDEPEAILEHARRYGAILRHKIDDMQAQVDRLNTEGAPDVPAVLLAVVPGDGFVPLFEALGARCLVHTDRLPSVADLVAAIGALDAPSVLLLPNHPNVLPTARMARDQVDTAVTILPTKTVLQGLASTYLFVPGGSAQDNLQGMRGGAELVTEVVLCRAAVDAAVGAVAIPAGSWFAMRDGTVHGVGTDAAEVVRTALGSLSGTWSLATLYRGAGCPADLAQQVEAAVAGLRPDWTVETLYGGQVARELLIALE